jgi:hypothetical protein
VSVKYIMPKIKSVGYNKKTKEVQTIGVFNCPLCSVGENVNKSKSKSKIYALKEMDADHVTA